MFELSIVDVFRYVYKHLKFILIITLLASVLSYFMADRAQNYTASIVIKYTYNGIETGKTPSGTDLDVYEIMNPGLIDNVIKSLNLNTNAESVRNSLSIESIIDEDTKEKIKAKTEKGEDYEYFPSEYIISYNYSGKFGFAHGNFVLNRLMQEYESFFRTQYAGQKVLADVIGTNDYSSLDYMELCDLYKTQLDQGLSYISVLAKENGTFRSSYTGKTFIDIQNQFLTLKNVEYTKLLAAVQDGLVSKNTETLIKRYQYKIEKLQLTVNKKQSESDLALQKMQDFYREYKAYHINNSNSNSTTGNNNSITGNILQTEEIEKFLTTYDDILMQYVNSGVEARSYQEDINYYQRIIDAYSHDNVPAERKLQYQKIADEMTKKIEVDMKDIVTQTNQTASDYYKFKSGQQITYLSSVNVVSNVSVNSYILVGFLAGFGISLFMAVTLEVIRRIKKQEEEKENEKQNETASEQQGLAVVQTEETHPTMFFDKEVFIAKALVEDIRNNFAGFKLYFQPTVDQNGRWIGAEALLRWENYRLGLVLPNDFIYIAERIGVMTALGEWVFKQSCLQCKQWNDSGLTDMNVCVNFSIHQICSPTFVDKICEILLQTKVVPENMMIEVSSRGEISDLQVVAQKLKAIKSLGVKISIDDFGTSTSSINLLHALPLDVIKIDRACVADLSSNHNKEMIESVLDIAHNMDLKVCAEGIENEAMMEEINGMGIDYMQGYGFAKPSDAGNFESNYQKAVKQREETESKQEIENEEDL